MQEWAPWVAIAIAAASLLYSIFNGRSEKNAEKFEATEKRFDDKVTDFQRQIDAKATRETVGVLHGKVDLLEDRATRIESDLRHLPDHSTVNKLEGMIGKLSGDVGVLSERIRPIAAIADRLQEKILESTGFER